jgi:hypothetical protein
MGGTASGVQGGDFGDCPFNASSWGGVLKTIQLPNNQPEAGARGARQKNRSRANGHLNYFRIGLGQPVVQLTGHSARSSGVDGKIEGLIVVNLNGEGRGVTCRAVKPNGKT